ncbi:MAG TPA: NAD(P)H-dependent glycerol-3-phosphate dehydrogenase [Dongiaceae bacterium]
MAALQRIAIVGAGAWGTALATVARRAGRDVAVWARSAEIAAEINGGHSNKTYLPDIALDPAIKASGDLAVLRDADALLWVTPAQHLREVAARAAPHLRGGVPVVLCCKGFEQGSGELMTEVAAEALPRSPIAVLSGPTFAAEVARGLPTAVTLAAANAALGRELVQALGTAAFRPYLSTDPIGAEVGGAVKNVLAIACGIAMGRKLGDNARAALLTRGLAEIMRLGLALGAQPATLMGLSGLGDLTLTCNGRQSRNLSLGIALGEGQMLAAYLAGRRTVAEGLFSASAVTARARSLKIEMPIAEAVDAIVNRNADIGETITALLSRPFREEAAGD